MKTTPMLGWVAALAILVLCACGGGSASGGNSETKLADQVTRAAYNNDISGVTQNFSPELAPQVTRASVGALSDKMHALGTYQGLTETAMDIPSRRYTFDAKFDKGDMTVGMRLDANGKILAYRVVPGTPH
jgi:hypothetical protein